MIAVCSIGLLAGACKKKDDAKKTDTPAAATDPAAKPADGTKPADPAAKPADPAAAAAPAAGADDAQQYVDLYVKLGKVFAADGKDCAKLVTDVKKFVADNKATFDAAKKRDAAQTPEQKKAEEEKYKPQMEQFMKDAEPAGEACKDNKELDAVMKDIM
jgi:hypothetical protein